MGALPDLELRSSPDGEIDLADLSATVMSLSAQTAEVQQAFAKPKRDHLPAAGGTAVELAAGAGLPTFEAGGLRLYWRLTLIARAGRSAKLFYPVFPEICAPRLCSSGCRYRTRSNDRSSEPIVGAVPRR